MIARTWAVLMVVLLCGTAGCSTISSGTSQELSFQSNPEDVTVTVSKRVRDSTTEYQWKDEVHVLGKTPVSVQMDKTDEPQSLTFSKEGFKPINMKLTTQVDEYFWGNAFFGGFLGTTTDSMTGAMYQYAPSQYFVTLIPQAAMSTESATLNTDRSKAKDFIVRRHHSLMNDLARSGGDDLAALMTLLHVQAGQEAQARMKLQSLADVYTDAVEYADRVTDLYLK